MDILIRKYTAKPIFHPHLNGATGRYYGTAREYVADLKAKGLEPYHPEQVKSPERKAYKASRWAHEMVETIKNASDRKGRVRLGSRFYDQLQAKGGRRATH